MITIKQVEALYWVHRLGSITAAADKLHTSQSAVTKRIGELELYYNVSLIDRRSRKATLTGRGLEVYQHAKELLRNRDRMQNLLSDSSSPHGRFRVGVTELCALTWMAAFAEDFRNRYPLVKLELEVSESAKLLHRLLDGALDMGVIESSFQDPRAGSIVLYEEPLAWMCAPGVLDAARVYAFEELAEQPLLSQGPGSSLAALYDRLFGVRGLLQKPSVTAPSLSSLAALTRAGLGVCCLPANYFSDQLAAGQMQAVQVDMPPLASEFAAMYRHDGVQGLARAAVPIAQSCVPLRRGLMPAPSRPAEQAPAAPLRH